jgi:long-chain acyl-CoA synthetase
MSYPTLTQRFLEAVDERPTPRALLYRAGGAWQAISSGEFLRRVAGLAHALAQLGVKAGDTVGLLSPNRPEWHIADFAIVGLGAADVPIYFRESSERLCTILNHCGARVVFAAGEEQVRLLLECRGQLRHVEHIVAAGTPADLDGEVLRYETLIERAGDREIVAYRQAAAKVRPGQLATMIYTSGTTGEPKGVMLTHANISSNDLDSCEGMEFLPDDVGLSFLPLAHVYERMIDCSYLFHGIPVAYVERPEDVQAALREVRPTLMACVPRVFEKIYEGIQARGQQLTGQRRELFKWAMRVAREAAPWRCHGQDVPLRTKAEWYIADAIAFPKIRAALGGRLRSCSSGSGPLRKDLIEFFTTVGVPIYQGYGLTETAPVVSTNRREANKIGTVGRPIRNVQVRIGADGEVLVKGPCVMRGYYRQEALTREVLGDDGWLHTGDIGFVDADGYLSITDRKKDLIKTAAGKYVAPQPIENKLKTSPLIANAAVLGDTRKFVVALVVPNFAAVEAEARRFAGLELASRSDVCANAWVRARMAEEIERLTAHLAQYEKIKRFALLDHDFTFDGGQLTYTMKLIRRAIEVQYRDVIERLYAEAEASQQEVGR